MKRLTTITTSACILASTFFAYAQPGSLDMTFNPGSGANAAIACMALETNGQIVIGGNFTSFNGTSQNYVTRLNAAGSLDSSFYPGVGAEGS
jgi:hypothetical protein